MAEKFLRNFTNDRQKQFLLNIFMKKKTYLKNGVNDKKNLRH